MMTSSRSRCCPPRPPSLQQQHLRDQGGLGRLCSVESVHASQRDELPRGRTLSKSLWTVACLPFAGREPACCTSGWKGGGGDSGDNRCLLKPQGTSLIASSPKLLSCNWWCPDSSPVIHISTVCHVTFWVAEGEGGGRQAGTQFHL